jgi:hypothetical protein
MARRVPRTTENLFILKADATMCAPRKDIFISGIPPKATFAGDVPEGTPLSKGNPTLLCAEFNHILEKLLAHKTGRVEYFEMHVADFGPSLAYLQSQRLAIREYYDHAVRVHDERVDEYMRWVRRKAQRKAADAQMLGDDDRIGEGTAWTGFLEQTTPGATGTTLTRWRGPRRETVRMMVVCKMRTGTLKCAHSARTPSCCGYCENSCKMCTCWRA